MKKVTWYVRQHSPRRAKPFINSGENTDGTWKEGARSSLFSALYRYANAGRQHLQLCSRPLWLPLNFCFFVLQLITKRELFTFQSILQCIHLVGKEMSHLLTLSFHHLSKRCAKKSRLCWRIDVLKSHTQRRVLHLWQKNVFECGLASGTTAAATLLDQAMFTCMHAPYNSGAGRTASLSAQMGPLSDYLPLTNLILSLIMLHRASSNRKSHHDDGGRNFHILNLLLLSGSTPTPWILIF